LKELENNIFASKRSFALHIGATGSIFGATLTNLN
jgi:hypothetical protein